MDVSRAYLESSLNMVSPERKLQALLEGAVQFIGRARKSLAAQDFEDCHNQTIKAQNIYLELLVALDPEAGAYVANLQGLYYLLYDILLDANIRKDDARYAEAQTIAERIQAMWEEVIEAAKEQAAPEVEPLPTPERHLNVAG